MWKFSPWTGGRLQTSSMNSRDPRVNLILPQGGVQTSALGLNCGFWAQRLLFIYASESPPTVFVSNRSAVSSFLKVPKYCWACFFWTPLANFTNRLQSTITIMKYFLKMQTVTGRDTAEIWGGEKGKRHQTGGSTALSLGSLSGNMASIASLSGGSAGFSMTLNTAPGNEGPCRAHPCAL